MNKEKIANIIYNELSYMYCDNCRYNDEEESEYRCEYCHRKSNSWGVSMAKAQQIAEMIGGTENE